MLQLFLIFVKRVQVSSLNREITGIIKIIWPQELEQFMFFMYFHFYIFFAGADAGAGDVDKQQKKKMK